MKSLYIHFPFCESRCHYCDFYALGKNRTRPDDPMRFEEALLRETSLSGHLLSPKLDTLFFGGGTPSLTSPESMKKAIDPLWKFTSLSREVEWTMEVNPSSASLENLRAYRALGVNRVSMGVQALRPDLLKSLGRVHSREQVFEALGNVFAAGFENVSVDLLCGVPDQSLHDIDQALQTLTRFPISHLSVYLLTLPPHHAMYPLLPNESEQQAVLLFVSDWMKSNGFQHYEISNFCRPGKEAKHNVNTWKGHSYLGLGPSAHSYDAEKSKRWKNISSLHKYAEQLERGLSPIEWSEDLTPEQRELEKWMLGLRLSDGVPESWFSKSYQKDKASSLLKEGLLENHPSTPQRLRLTPVGFTVSDSVIRALA